MTRIAYTTDIGAFVIMKAMLEDAGMRVLDLAHAGHVSVAGADQGFYVRVDGEQADQARKIIADSQFSNLLLSNQ